MSSECASGNTELLAEISDALDEKMEGDDMVG